MRNPTNYHLKRLATAACRLLQRLCTLGAITGLALMASACANYAVSVNERTVYTPPALLKTIEASDPALVDCITQTIADFQVTEAKQLKQLNCSNAGIQSVTGLAQFNQLQRLQFANNQIVDISPLSLLAELTELDLSDNRITNITPLRALKKLTALNLKNNPDAVCKGTVALQAQVKGELQLPNACVHKTQKP